MENNHLPSEQIETQQLRRRMRFRLHPSSLRDWVCPRNHVATVRYERKNAKPTAIGARFCTITPLDERRLADDLNVK